MMKSTLIKDLYGEIERLKAGKRLLISKIDDNWCFYLNLWIHIYPLPPPTLSLLIEVYATREKNGVYIPKERYYQEESDKKVLLLPTCSSWSWKSFRVFCYFLAEKVDWSYCWWSAMLACTISSTGLLFSVLLSLVFSIFNFRQCLIRLNKWEWQ